MPEAVRGLKDRKGAVRMPEPLPEEYLSHVLGYAGPEIIAVIDEAVPWNGTSSGNRGLSGRRPEPASCGIPVPASRGRHSRTRGKKGFLHIQDGLEKRPCGQAYRHMQ